MYRILTLAWIIGCVPVCERPSVQRADNSLGTVVSVREDAVGVQVRQAARSDWTDLEAASKVYAQDLLRNLSDQTVVISLGEGVTIELGPKTWAFLISRSLYRKTETVIVALAQGTLVAKVKSPTGRQTELLVRTPRIWVKADSLAESVTLFKTHVATRWGVKVEAGTGSVDLLAKEFTKKIEEKNAFELPDLTNPFWSSPAPEGLDYKSFLEMPALQN